MLRAKSKALATPIFIEIDAAVSHGKKVSFVRRFLITIFVSVLFVNTVSAGTNSSVTHMAREGVDQLLSLEFEKAALAFKRLESRYPDYPLIAFLNASVYWVKAEASQGGERKPAWNEASAQLARAIGIAEQGVEENPDNHLWQLNLGMATFFAGRAEVEHQHILKAIRYARKGRDILRELIEEHPDTEAAYFVLGMYEYVAGSVPRSLRWLTYILDISGDRDLGIKYLERATARAEVMAPEAARMLLAAAAVQPEYVEPCKYISLARDVRRKYPQNPHYSAALQLILAHCGYPKESLAENKRAFRVYLKRFPGMTDALNLVKLQVYPAMGAMDEIEKLAPVFKTRDHHHWYLAKAQVYDVLGDRKKAKYMYREIELAGDDLDNSTTFADQPPDLVYEKALIYLKQPYRRPEPAEVNNNNALSLNVLGEKPEKRLTSDSIGW
jgi:tetratricopeptide (TPR) repeat protein